MYGLLVKMLGAHYGVFFFHIIYVGGCMNLKIARITRNVCMMKVII